MNTPAALPQPFLPLNSPHATLVTVGGKGANLARLARAGFNVPTGFLIPTESYKDFVTEHKLDSVIREALDNLDFNNPATLEDASKGIRSQFRLAPVSQTLRDALFIAYNWIGAAPPVAVRSSATAEDLPDMSFAGQQDTYLNIIGIDALTDAVVACWGSLWTARAIGYRARNEIPQEDVSLSVAVQKMVQSDVSGVMFTANPLSGKHDEIVIDATFGLGEALVSGQVEPDNYIVESTLHPKDALRSASAEPTRSASHLKTDATHFSIISKTLGAKATVIRSEPKGGTKTETSELAQIKSESQALPDEIILKLAELGQQIQSEYNFPQDIEWAYHEESLYILQSRPITSLYPIPEGLRAKPLKVTIGFHIVQGVHEPYTPLGIETIQNVLAGGSHVFGADYTYETQTAVLQAGDRIWANVTSLLKHPLGHKLYPGGIRGIDPPTAQIIERLLKDEPDLAVVHQRPTLRGIINLLKFIVPFWGRVFHAWRHPEEGAKDFFARINAKIADVEARSQNSGELWRDYRNHVELWHESIKVFPETAIPYGLSSIVAGMIPFMGVLQRFSKEIGEPQLYLEIARGLSNNVTTEMDLFLWKTAQDIRADAESARLFTETPALQLATAYQANSLPDIAQQAVAQFMSRYGMRGLGEIDLGRPRWREEPLPILQTLQSYLEIDDPNLAPDVVFARGAVTAELAGKGLESKVRLLKGGRLKSRLVRWALPRYRALTGLREAPKFFIIQVFGIIRKGLLESGQKLVELGLLDGKNDLFFLKVKELQEIGVHETVSAEMRAKIAKRREDNSRELRRKQLPRVLLSDGRAFFEGLRDVDNENGIFGDAVSLGVVEGLVRVVLNPHETRLEVGEILVCPGTDPAWTPLFLAAGGLVMEVGGLMTHGSVVAREYGIPAVVGVHEATTRLQTGMRIRVDGSNGVIEIVDE